MNTRRISVSFVLAALALGVAPDAHPVEVAAGDWKFTFNGNVNVHYIFSDCEEETIPAVAGGLACRGFSGEENSSSISNGLLPAAFALGASTTQRGYDLSVTLGLYPGISTNDGGSPNLQVTDPTARNTALGTTGLDVRQVFMTVKGAFGEVMAGRNAGLFQYDSIINDMTLPGVGGGSSNYATPSNTSLGSIGLGYIYTDWLAQINYTTPDFSGLKITVGVFDPLEPLGATPVPDPAPGFHGKIAYTRENLYLSASFLTQQHEGLTDAADFDSTGFDVGGKVKVGPLEVMGWYYDTSGVGTTGLYVLADAGNGNERDSDGFLVQAVVSFGPDNKTKFGVNYGESNLDLASGELPSALVESNSKYTVGLYHGLTENLTLLAEFTDIEAEAHNGIDNESRNFNVGGFLSF